jgi:hypothetical protein
MEECGVGALPACVSSVSCMLVYNSHINPYHKYNATLDNLLDAYDRR